MIASDSVVDAFREMVRRDFRGAMRSLFSSTNPQMGEEELRERVAAQAAYCEVDAAVARKLEPHTPSRVTAVDAVGDDEMILDLGPRSIEHVASALARHVKPEVAAFVRAVFSLHDPQELEELTSGAGFRGVEVRSEALTLTLPGPAEFLWQYVHSTPLAPAVAQLDDVGRAALQRDVVTAWRSFVKDGALADDVNVVLTTART